MRMDGAEVDAEVGQFTSAGDMDTFQALRPLLVVLDLRLGNSTQDGLLLLP